MLKSCIISGIAGRSIVSEKKTVSRVLLSNASVNHALRLMVIGSIAIPSSELPLFSDSSGSSILRILIGRRLALFIVNGKGAPYSRHSEHIIVLDSEDHYYCTKWLDSSSLDRVREPTS